MTSKRIGTLTALALLLALLTSGCIGMPESGPVRATTSTGARSDTSAININPRHPGKDDDPTEIVRGFLEAMTATPPITTTVAREFLTKAAAATWQPTETIVYSTASTGRRPNQVTVQLGGANRTDARGAWLGPLTPAEANLTFDVDFKDGQYRISDPPQALIVPQSWFDQRFRVASLYFFDATATVLVPEPVFVPRGRQFASSLVNGLLAGPEPELVGHELSFVPSELRSVAVPVSESGLARVDLVSDAADDVMPDPTEAELLVSQLAWTLRQDTSITSFRVTIGGRPVQLADRATTFGVDDGGDYAPYVAGSSTRLFGLRDGLMVGGTPDNLLPVEGPFGTSGYALRAVATDLDVERVAGVTADGTEVLVAPVHDRAEPAVRVAEGENLLRPAWDFSGRLWVADRRRGGSVISFVQDGRQRPLDVPGVSGNAVTNLLVSRDGTRLVAVIRDRVTGERVVTSRILTNGEGRVVDATPAVTITDDSEYPIRAIAWRSTTSVLVLRAFNRRLFSVRTVAVDGAPTAVDAVATTVDREVLGLAGTPVPGESLYAVTPYGLSDLSVPRGNLTSVGIGLTSLDYVG